MEQQRLDREARRIADSVRRAPYGARVEIRARWAARVEDLREALLSERPDVVHFAAHGTPDEEIAFEDELENATLVEGAALAELFQIFEREVRLVMLSACYSRPQAEAIVKHVDCAVGMGGAIGDAAAAEFSAAFYQAVAFGESVERAFRLGVNALRLKQIPDTAVPQLLMRTGIDPKTVVLLKPPEHLAPVPTVEEAGERRGEAPSRRMLPHPGPGLAADGPVRLRSQRLARAAALAALVLVGVAAIIRSKQMDNPSPQPIATAAASEPPLEPFPPETFGIVIGGPWVGTEDGRAFCRALKDLDMRPDVRCLPISMERTRFSARAAELRQRAKLAGAAVAMAVSDQGRGRIFPLGHLESHEVLDKAIISIDLEREADRSRTPPLLTALARLGGSGEVPGPEGPPCPVRASDSIDRIALLAMLLIPACSEEVFDARKLLAFCAEDAPADDDGCALARYVYAEHFPDDARVKGELEKLRDKGPAAFRDVAELKLSRLDCDGGKLKDAVDAIDRLFVSGASPCAQAAVSEIASCVMARSRAPVDQRIVNIEALPIQGYVGCRAAARGRILGSRAYYRGLAQRWTEAAVDYHDAYQLLADPAYVLGHAESLLHIGKSIEAGALLRGLPAIQKNDKKSRMRAALLAWIAARDAVRPEEASYAVIALCAVHRELSADERALPEERDPDLRRLACPSSSKRPCVYDVLVAPKTDEARASLARAIGRCP